VWDNFIAKSKNGAFPLFFRNYMEYHSDRFEDHSLIFFEGDELIAVMPANIKDNTLFSHAGLTYGGIVSDTRMTTVKMVDIFSAMKDYSSSVGISSILYKVVPHIYHNIPAEEDSYALFRNQAQLVKRDVSSAAFIPNFKMPSKRLWGARKSENSRVRVEISDNYDEFINIVNNRLAEKYKLKPVHTADEIKLLARRFPEQIKLFAAYQGENMVAGAIMYESQVVVHAQYLSTTQEGRELKAMDLLITQLITKYYSAKRWFDFGISTEQDGYKLNESLIKHKELFGTSAVCYDTYRISIS
jgi:Acetyltransferase (GNAT) domain